MSIEALVAWATAGGAYLDPIEVRVGPDGNRSVFARRAIDAGELLVSIPRSIMIGRTDIDASSVGISMRSFASMLHSRYMPLAVWLAMERRADSPWRSYVDALPESFPVWAPEVLEALEGTRAGELLEERAQKLDEDWSLLCDVTPAVAQLSRADVEWGLRVARSRCFEVAAAGGYALVPIFDMFDHSPLANAVWSYDAEASRFAVRALHDLRVDDEIRHCYGTYDNAHWLAGYGFVLESNPDDEVTLRIGHEDVHLGAAVDQRFERALQLAGDMSELREAARQADERIARAAGITTDPFWERTCRIVRDGERAVLAAIIATSRSV